MLKPSFKIKTEKQTDDYGLFSIEPLEQGYGHTLGNALRRVLLTSLEGYAITRVNVKGVNHRFSTLEGMKEDVIELILNLKKLRIRSEKQDGKSFNLKMSVSGPKKVTGADIKTPAGVEIVNQDLILAQLAKKTNKLDVELEVQQGLGYLPSSETEVSKLGEIPVDAVFSPVLLVNYKVEATRVGRRTDYDKVILEVRTDGTVKPKDAIVRAAKILTAYFEQVYEPKRVEKKASKPKREPEVYNLTVEELNLPTRIANALRKGGYKTVKALVEADLNDVAKVKNIGKKSVKIVVKRLKEKDVELE